MNTAPVTEQPDTTTGQPTPLINRTKLTDHIREAKMQQSTKNLAVKLLERNLLLGDTYHITLDALRHLCHAANNLDATKHLRKLRRVGLITYEIDFRSGQVALRFVVGAKRE